MNTQNNEMSDILKAMQKNMLIQELQKHGIRVEIAKEMPKDD